MRPVWGEALHFTNLPIVIEQTEPHTGWADLPRPYQKRQYDLRGN